MNVHVTIDPERGFLSTRPEATRDFYQRKIVKAQTDRARPVEVRVTGTGVMRYRTAHTPTQARLGHADALGMNLAKDFKFVRPWTGVSEGR